MSNIAEDRVVPLRRLREAGKQVPLMAVFTDAIERVGDGARSALESSDEFVRERPWQAAALVGVVGIGVGLLAAWLVRSRRVGGPDGALAKAADRSGDL